MGGCASKPKDLDSQQAPVPVENPEKAEEKTATETKTEEPLVDLSEPAAEAPKVEEATEAVAEDAKPAEESTEVKAEDATEKAEEPEKEEEKKDEAAAAEVAAPKPDEN